MDEQKKIVTTIDGLDEFLTRYRLPDSFASIINEFYIPLARWLYARMTESGPGTFVLGINGAQGTGKTTLSNFLSAFLWGDYGLSVAELSIDDIYLTRAERTDLAQRVHPLLATRGVPGTHDVDFGETIIDELCALRVDESMSLPRFDKSVDDRQPAGAWPDVTGPIDLIVFEGWCVGSTALPADDLAEPVNRLEAEEDSDCAWRRYVNEQLATTYRGLFNKIDALVFLEAPGFDAIHRWRLDQERKLAASVGADGTQVMDEASLTRFIQYYERITRHNLVTLPSRADVVLTLDEVHAVTHASYAG
jgi:D-glycerate 3-kinase